MSINRHSLIMNPSRICTVTRNHNSSIPVNTNVNFTGSNQYTSIPGKVNSGFVNGTTVKTPQTWGEIYPSRHPNLLLLTPAFFGAAAAFIVGFTHFGHSLSSGYNKYIFFINVYAIIGALGAGAYIYEVLRAETGRARLNRIIIPLITIIVFYSLLFNLTYSLYPSTYSGTIGDTPITQWISFLALSIGSISVGETYNITPERTGSQILTAGEAFWNLFVLSLLIALVAF